jgi:serine protease
MNKFHAFILFILVHLSVSAQYSNLVPNQILVQKRPGAEFSEMNRRVISYSSQSCEVNLKEVLVKNSIYLYQTTGVCPSEISLIRQLSSIDEIQFAQGNHKISSRRDTTPNDPRYPDFWHLKNTGQLGGNPGSDISAPSAWGITTGGKTPNGETVVIAVIDDGTEIIPELQKNQWFNEHEIPNNLKDDDGNGFIDDYLGWNSKEQNDDVLRGDHGVGVESFVGMVGNNGIGGTGVNWETKIMTIKYGGPVESEVIKSYDYVLKQRKLYNASNGAKGAFVVATNSSWGVDRGKPADAPIWCAFYDSLGVAGILNLGATSNDPIDVDKDGDLPTACPSPYMLSVTATDNRDFRNFSGFGKKTIDLGSPGDALYFLEADGSIGLSSGTSFATPIVAGLVGLMYAIPCVDWSNFLKNNREQGPLSIKNLILNGVDPVSNLKNETLTGGRLNAFKPLKKIIDNCGNCQKPWAVEFLPLSYEPNLDQRTLTKVDIQESNSSSYRVFYRKTNETNWSLPLTISNGDTLKNLPKCSELELYFQPLCESGIPINAEYRMSTGGCCSVKESIAFQDLPNGRQLLVLGGDPWDIYKELEITWPTGVQMYTVNKDTISFPSPGECLPISLEVTTFCKNSNVSSTRKIELFTQPCPFCIEGGYCTAISDPKDEWISKVRLGSTQFSSGKEPGGGGRVTPFIGYLTPGGFHSIELTPDYTSTRFSETFRVWVDFDQNGRFDFNEKMQNIRGNTTKLDFLQVPNNVKPGNTRMRIRMEPLPFSNFLGECDSVTRGEAEDYCVEILGKDTLCPAIEGLAYDSIQGLPRFSWSALNGADQYRIRYREVNTSNWEESYTTETQFVIPNLKKCTNYFMNVGAVCGRYTGTERQLQSIFTPCITNSDEIQDHKILVLYPQPCQNHLVIPLNQAGYDYGEIRIMDISGSIQWRRKVGGGFGDIQVYGLENLASGFYTLSLQLSKDEKTQNYSGILIKN